VVGDARQPTSSYTGLHKSFSPRITHDLSFRAQVFRSVGISLGSLAAHAGHPAHGVDEVEGKGHRTFRPTEIVCQPAAGKQVTKKIPWQ